MYRLKAGDTEYTIPKENIGMLAYVKAKDNGDIIARMIERVLSDF